MADAITGLTEAGGTATIETLVAGEVKDVLNANMVVGPTLKDMSQFVSPGMDTLKYPKFSNFSVSTKSENTAVDAQINAFTADTLSLNRHKVIQFLIEDIAELQSKVNMLQAYAAQAAVDLAIEMDQYLLDTLEGGVSTSAPDHKRAYAGSNIAAADILVARQLLNEAKVPMEDRYLVISPAQEAALLGISSFTSAADFGSREPVVNGQIGRLYGFNVLMSQLAEDAKSMAYHKSAVIWARQLAPRVQQFYDVPNLAQRWSMDHIYGAVATAPGVRSVLLGTA